MKELLRAIEKAVNLHSTMTKAAQKILLDSGFSYGSITKYKNISSKTLLKYSYMIENELKFYVAVGTAAVQYGYFKENYGFSKEITEKEYNKLPGKFADFGRLN